MFCWHVPSRECNVVRSSRVNAVFGWMPCHNSLENLTGFCFFTCFLVFHDFCFAAMKQQFWSEKKNLAVNLTSQLWWIQSEMQNCSIDTSADTNTLLQKKKILAVICYNVNSQHIFNSTIHILLTVTYILCTVPFIVCHTISYFHREL